MEKSEQIITFLKMFSFIGSYIQLYKPETWVILDISLSSKPYS